MLSSYLFWENWKGKEALKKPFKYFSKPVAQPRFCNEKKHWKQREAISESKIDKKKPLSHLLLQLFTSCRGTQGRRVLPIINKQHKPQVSFHLPHNNCFFVCKSQAQLNIKQDDSCEEGLQSIYWNEGVKKVFFLCQFVRMGWTPPNPNPAPYHYFTNWFGQADQIKYKIFKKFH